MFNAIHSIFSKEIISSLSLMTAPSRARNWVFTINNFSEDEKNAVIELQEKDCVLRLCAETEHTGEGQGTPHIQGYVSFVNLMYIDTVKHFLGSRAHVEIARGGWKQNFRYCSKEGTVFAKKGENPDDKLSMTVTESALENMKNMSCREFQDAYPNIWFFHRSKVLATMLDYAMRRVKNWDGDLKAKNFWIWGDPGVGKSKWATSLVPTSEQYRKNANKWWDGFSFIEHTLVIIEDYPEGIGGNCLVQFVKIWGDRYPFIGEVKGGSIQIQPGRFNLVITSNYPIDRCFLNQQDIEAIKRRFTEKEVTHINRILLQDLRPDRSLLDH